MPKPRLFKAHRIVLESSQDEPICPATPAPLEPSPGKLRTMRWLQFCAAVAMLGALAWAVAQSQATSDIGSFLEIDGQVVGPANSSTLHSTNDVTGGDQVRWTAYSQSRLASPFEAEGLLALPAGQTWVAGSARKPANTSLSWQVNGAWQNTEPANGAAVSAVKWQASTRIKTASSPIATAINFSGTGDGYRVIPYKDKLFVLNHGSHQHLHCRNASDGQLCAGWSATGTRMVPSVPYVTRNAPIEALNQDTGELFVGLLQSDGINPEKAVIACKNLDTLAHCGTWDIGGKDAANLRAVNNKYYVVNSLSQLVCFDIAKRELCGTTSYPGSYQSPLVTTGTTTSLALGDYLFFADSKAGNIYCHLASSNSPCPGWGTTGKPFGGGVYPYLTPWGAPAGVCPLIGNCVSMTGGSFQPHVSYTKFLREFGLFTAIYNEVVQDMSAIIGSKVYGASDTNAGCFDFATMAPCGKWRAPTNLLMPYSARIDPTRQNCVMILGHTAQAMIFDGNTGGACQGGLPPALPDLVVNPLAEDFQCNPARAQVRAWGRVRLSPSLPWGGSNGLNRVTVTLKDAQGNKLPERYQPVRIFPVGKYQLDISDVPFGLYPVLKVGIELSSPSPLPAGLQFGFDLTYDGDPAQVCVTAKAPASPDCQTTALVTLNTRTVDSTSGTWQETLTAGKVLSPGGLSSGYSAVVTATSIRSVLHELGARDPATAVAQGRWALQNFTGDLWVFGLGPNGQIDGSSVLSAQAATAAPAARPLYTATAASSVQPLQPLAWAALSAGQQGQLDRNLNGVEDGQGAARLAYLRGSDGGFRPRAGSTLGPVINSSPAMLLPAATVGLMERNYPGYTAYRASVARPHPMALFGGNDGALHAYEVRPGTLREAWSFVPNVMLRRAANFADPTIAGIRANPYFVDNIPMVGHANTTGTKDGWRAVAVLTYGRGARAITALDVTKADPSQGDGQLFEYSNTSDPELKDLGYIISQPVSNNAMVSQQIVQLGQGEVRRAAVLVGNGINSNDGQGGVAASGTGKAVLYAFYLDKGAKRWQRWAVDELWAGAASEPGLRVNNGLSTPTPVDVDDDGRVDLVYAGDMQGNLWRFDVRDPAAPSVTRLFKTEALQPLTQAPFVSMNTLATGCGSQKDNATADATRCWQVVFATGAPISPLLGSPIVATQSIYGVLDKGRGVTVAQGQLTRIPFELNTVINGVEYRALKPTTVNYKGDSLGWVVDLQDYEHGVGAPRLQPTGLVMFSSIRPTTPDKAINVCIGPRSWLNELDPLNGYSTVVPFDTNGDGNIDGQDQLNANSSTPLSPSGMAVSGAQFGPPALLLAASTQAQQMSLLLPSLGQDTGQAHSWSGGVGSGGSAAPGSNSAALTHANKAKLGRMTWREVY